MTGWDVRLTPENVTELQRELDSMARARYLTPGGLLAVLRTELSETRVETSEPSEPDRYERSQILADLRTIALAPPRQSER